MKKFFLNIAIVVLLLSATTPARAQCEPAGMSAAATQVSVDALIALINVAMPATLKATFQVDALIAQTALHMQLDAMRQSLAVQKPDGVLP